MKRGIFLHSRFDVLERELAVPFNGGEPLVPVTWRNGTHADIDAFTKDGLNYDSLRKQYAHKALDEGGEFIVALHEEEIIHVGWISYKEIVFPGFILKLGPSRAYFYDTRTVDRFQGNRLQGAGIRKRMEAAKERGVTHAVNCVSTSNGTSRRNYQREGFEVIAGIETWRLFKKWRRAQSPGWLQPYLLGQGGKPDQTVMTE